MEKVFVGAFIAVLVLLGTACSAGVSAPDAGSDEERSYVSPEEVAHYEEIWRLLEGVCVQLDVMDVNRTPVYLWGEEYVQGFHPSGKAAVNLDQSIGDPFIEICAKKGVDPFRGFLVLKESGLVESYNPIQGGSDGVQFEYREDLGAAYELNALTAVQTVASYPYTQEGCQSFVNDVTALVKSNVGIFNTNSDYPTVVYLAEAGGYCSTVMTYDAGNAFITKICLRSGDGKTITDVTLQAMSIDFPLWNCTAGIGMSMTRRETSSRFEVVCLITAIEQILVGDNYFSEYTDIPVRHTGYTYVIPAEYRIGEYAAELSRNNYRFQEELYEDFELHTYHLGVICQ